ncbi:VOC family protein [Actinospica sp.]|jgi:catechol 2,3-dioxygenase-like lactoylglutathione lyase family enzyme|uniref:VOC family protein n=1 Tax=Actinospica sp. TaxID=1872142 RepID=UPI002B80CE62|nr:VOC family protein [Actinospica sp.]HWG25322.1 VOC family protein [Actinospica sp.]
MSRPSINLTATVIGTPAPRKLARFYAELLGWTIGADEQEWATVRPEAGAGLSFQIEEHHRRPVWPGNQSDQQMMMHLDFQVEDLEVASKHAVSLGALVAHFQPQDDVIVHFDPDGHPFCLWIATGEPEQDGD